MDETPVLLDVESRSRADLRVVGGRRYWEHPSSEVLVLAWHDTRDGSSGTWHPGEAWPFAGRTLAAHNAHGFDRHACTRYGIHADWIDTAQLARKAGLPGALDALGTRWCSVPKDTEASRFTRALSSVRRPGKAHGTACVAPDVWRAMSADEQRARGVQPTYDTAARERVERYCISDVEILVRAWPRLRAWLHTDADAERVDAAINDRGVAFDSSLARRLLGEDERLAHEAVNACACALGVPDDAVASAARSPAQFCAITGLPDAQAITVETCEHPLARVRKALASVAAGKLTSGLARVHDDGRLRDTLLYYGAHTGRWSGRGMQLQNLPRGAKRFEDVDVGVLAEQVLAGRACDADEVALLVRATLTARAGDTLVACDYSSIEARATAWAAGDEAALDVFRAQRDPYKVAASAIYSCAYDGVTKAQRQTGKLAELACGYGGGTGALERIARAQRVDVSGLGRDDIVAGWRRLHAPIVRLWYACERAFTAAANGRATYVGPWRFLPGADVDAGAIACMLPSRRLIVYADVHVDGDGCASYLGTRGRQSIYGGKLVENAVQATCRDLMADALVRAERAGLRPVLTVHDEIVCEVPACAGEEALAFLRAIMVDAPGWSAGLPIEAEGWIGKRYRK